MAGAAVYTVREWQQAKDKEEAEEINKQNHAARVARMEELREHYATNPQASSTSQTAQDLHDANLAVVESLVRQLRARAENVLGRATRLLPAPVLGYSEPPEFVATFALILLGEPRWFKRFLQDVWMHKVKTGEVPSDPTIDPAVVDELGFVLASLSPSSARLLRLWFEELSVITPLKVFHSTRHFRNVTKDRLGAREQRALQSLDALNLLDEAGYVAPPYQHAPPQPLLLRMTSSILFDVKHPNLIADTYQIDDATQHDLHRYATIVNLVMQSNPFGLSGGPHLRLVKLREPHCREEFDKLRAALHHLGLFAYSRARSHSPGFANGKIEDIGVRVLPTHFRSLLIRGYC